MVARKPYFAAICNKENKETYTFMQCVQVAWTISCQNNRHGWKQAGK